MRVESKLLVFGFDRFQGNENPRKSDLSGSCVYIPSESNFHQISKKKSYFHVAGEGLEGTHVTRTILYQFVNSLATTKKSESENSC